jgi:hypothetical protein
LFVVAAFVRGLQRGTAAPGTHVRKARSSPTAVGDTIIGAAVAKETVDNIAGHPARDTPSATTLIAFAMTVYGFRAGIKRLLHEIRPSLRHLTGAAHRVQAVMRRWGISPTDSQVSPGANTRAVDEDRAHADAAATGYKQQRIALVLNMLSWSRSRLPLLDRRGSVPRRIQCWRGCWLFVEGAVSPLFGQR